MKKVYLLALVFAIISLLFAQNVKYKVDAKACIGCTLCVNKCPVKAIEMKDKKAVIDPAKCIGCGLCVPACPVKAIDKDIPAEKVIPADSVKKALPDSSDKKLKENRSVPAEKTESNLELPVKQENIGNTESMSATEKSVADIVKTIFKVDAKSCIGCKICIAKCPVKAITYQNRTAIIDPAKCIGCGLCAPVCPVKSISKTELVIKGN